MVKVVMLKIRWQFGDNFFNIFRSQEDINKDIEKLEYEGYEYFDKARNFIIFSKEK